jgi:hypothetical protein
MTRAMEHMKKAMMRELIIKKEAKIVLVEQVRNKGVNFVAS